MSCFLTTLTGRPPACERGEGVWGNREVPPQSRRRGYVGETWFPPRKRAEGERRSCDFHLLQLPACAVVRHVEHGRRPADAVTGLVSRAGGVDDRVDNRLRQFVAHDERQVGLGQEPRLE